MQKNIYGAQIGSRLLEWQKEVEDCKYQYRKDFIALQFSNNMEKIGRYAFGRCTELVSVSMPDSIKELGEGAFFGCKKLEYVKLSNSLTTIPQKCFSNCVNLKEIRIPESVNEIEKYAFSGCKGLERIYIPINTIIGDHSLPNNFNYMYVSSENKEIIFSKNIITDINTIKCRTIKNSSSPIFYKDENTKTESQKNNKKSQNDEIILEK